MADLTNKKIISQVNVGDGNGEYVLDAAYLNSKTADEIIAEAVVESKKSRFLVVAQIPTATNAEENVIYLVPSTNGEGDSYDEYVLVDGVIEKIGNTDIDLSEYCKKGTETSAAAGNTGSGGSGTFTTSSTDLGTAVGTVEVTYKKASSVTSAETGAATITSNTGHGGQHTHTFTGTSSTIEIECTGAIVNNGEHNHTITPSTTNVVETVTGTPGTILAAPAET